MSPRTRPRRHLRTLLLCLCCCCAALCARARRALAADTVEAWEVGAVDVDLYLGLDGLGAGSGGRSYSSDLMVGYGLVERLSVYAGVSLEGNQDLSEGSHGGYLGLYGTPLQTDHLDLDLFLDLRATGPGLGQLQLQPALELNLDADPEMRTWGLYLRAGLPLLVHDSVEAGGARALALESTLGGYVRLRPRHQLVLELDGAYRPAPADDERRWELGGLALGYNVVLDETVELINQVFVDLPQAGEGVAVGLLTGFILTLPNS